MTTETIKQEVSELISELFKDKGFDIDIIEYVDLIDDLGALDGRRSESL